MLAYAAVRDVNDLREGLMRWACCTEELRCSIPCTISHSLCNRVRLSIDISQFRAAIVFRSCVCVGSLRCLLSDGAPLLCLTRPLLPAAIRSSDELDRPLLDAEPHRRTVDHLSRLAQVAMSARLARSQPQCPPTAARPPRPASCDHDKSSRVSPLL